MPRARTFSFDAELWLSDGHGGFHFLDLPEEMADVIDAEQADRRAGFGSVRVEVTIGSTTWLTSLFPDTKRKTYVLPVKKAVRTAEQLEIGSVAHVDLVVQ